MKSSAEQAEQNVTHQMGGNEPVDAYGAITATSLNRKPGRPTKYTPANVKKLCSALDDGLTLEQACIVSRVSYGAVMVWQREKPGFAEKLEEAREKVAQRHLQRIQAASADDWRASEAFLKLSRPQFYKRPQITHETHSLNVDRAIVILPPDEQEKLIQQHLRLRALAGNPVSPEEAKSLQLAQNTNVERNSNQTQEQQHNVSEEQLQAQHERLQGTSGVYGRNGSVGAAAHAVTAAHAVDLGSREVSDEQEFNTEPEQQQQPDTIDAELLPEEQQDQQPPQEPAAIEQDGPLPGRHPLEDAFDAPPGQHFD